MSMKLRRSDYDVTNTVQTTDAASVAHEVLNIFQSLYPLYPVAPLEQAFHDWQRLFEGEFPGFMACDTPYHDLQHTLDVTLAMARLIWGYERNHQEIGPLGALLGLITALFHDAGYVRSWYDVRHHNGAELTRVHVSRSAIFLDKYLPTVGLQHGASICRKLVHFTGYEVAISEIEMEDAKLRSLGKLIGTADLLAQMSDRCYLEKCRDRLYPEFVAAGMASPDGPHGGYPTAEDFLTKTPFFFAGVKNRLDKSLCGVHRYLSGYFADGSNLYERAVLLNQGHLDALIKANDLSLLRRNPPWTLRDKGFPIDLTIYR
jgi:hypothetical protein